MVVGILSLVRSTDDRSLRGFGPESFVFDVVTLLLDDAG